MASRHNAMWTVLECAFLPDRAGTAPSFEAARPGNEGCELRFRHRGLTPRLECFSDCKPGWECFLASLHHYVESGRGNPFAPVAAEAMELP